MQAKKQQHRGARISPHFEGLWLCRKTAPDEVGLTFRHALLFATHGNGYFLVRFNHSDMDEGGMTFYFTYDYKVSPQFIHQHPLGYPEDFRVDIGWRAGDDGSLTLQYEDGADRFYPATWDQVFSLGFERDEVEEALTQAREAGWLYSLASRFPDFTEIRATRGA